jgi:hypothetical protein
VVRARRQAWLASPREALPGIAHRLFTALPAATFDKQQPKNADNHYGPRRSGHEMARYREHYNQMIKKTPTMLQFDCKEPPRRVCGRLA